MLVFLENHFETIIGIALMPTLILLIFCIAVKLLKRMAAAIILAIAVPVLFTIFWGNGGAYIARFASFFEPAYQQQIEDAYQYYREKDLEDPFVDPAAVSETAANAVDALRQAMMEQAD